jgi:hypothetical protein
MTPLFLLPVTIDYGSDVAHLGPTKVRTTKAAMKPAVG